jgi:hemolysin activation/secretion protein
MTATAYKEGKAVMYERYKHVQRGDWRTLETFWNASTTVMFRGPAGAKIKLRYGVGWFGFDRAQQTLDGTTIKKLDFGADSLARIQVQMKVDQDCDVRYAVAPTTVAKTVTVNI